MINNFFNRGPNNSITVIVTNDQQFIMFAHCNTGSFCGGEGNWGVDSFEILQQESSY